MVHNGIEYGIMQAYAEGFDILKNKDSHELPEAERFSLDMGDIAEVWRRGSVISSWLLDLTALALATDETLEKFSGDVSDSGEGRWTIDAAVEEGRPRSRVGSVPVRPLPLAAGAYLRREDALRHALRLWRPRGTKGVSSTGDTEALAQTTKPAPRCTLAIFGAYGDLTKRLLMPALYNLSGSKLLDDKFAVLGVDRDPGTDDDFRGRQKAMMESFTPKAGGEFAEAKLDEYRLELVAGSAALHRRGLHKARDVPCSRRAARRRQRHLLPGRRRPLLRRHHRPAPWSRSDRRRRDGTFRRVVIEKPFGHDLASAKELNAHILAELDESQIYRIDHFLGKETVQNIMALRFANGLFEPLWNRDHIDHVEISAAETVGVEKRGKFYEVTGALRDMVPNHMFQLLSMIAMEPPNSFEADAVRTEKAKVIEAIHPMNNADVQRNVVRGQYVAGIMKDQGDVSAYTDEQDVDGASTVETYVALRLTIDNWRWAGVPFYMRTGKRMAAPQDRDCGLLQTGAVRDVPRHAGRQAHAERDGAAPPAA